MVEDFDEDGNVKSSIPVQFLAIVWTPVQKTEEYLFENARALAKGGRARQYEFPAFFEDDMHDDLHERPDLSKYKKPTTTRRPTTPRPGPLGPAL